MSRMIIEREFPPGDYMERLSQLFTAYDQATKDESDEQGGPRLMLEGSASEELREQYEALRAEAREAAKGARRLVRLQGITRGQKKDLERRHPPRKEGDPETVESDQMAGLNLDTVEDDLLYATVIEPEFKSRADFDEWLNDELTDGEANSLIRVAWQLANVAQFDPKSLPASQTQRLDETSE